jgi:hypothetical protein
MKTCPSFFLFKTEGKQGNPLPYLSLPLSASLCLSLPLPCSCNTVLCYYAAALLRCCAAVLLCYCATNVLVLNLPRRIYTPSSTPYPLSTLQAPLPLCSYAPILLRSHRLPPTPIPMFPCSPVPLFPYNLFIPRSAAAACLCLCLCMCM